MSSYSSCTIAVLNVSTFIIKSYAYVYIHFLDKGISIIISKTVLLQGEAKTEEYILVDSISKEIKKKEGTKTEFEKVEMKEEEMTEEEKSVDKDIEKTIKEKDEDEGKETEEEKPKISSKPTESLIDKPVPNVTPAKPIKPVRYCITNINNF